MFEIEYLCPFVAVGVISPIYFCFSGKCIRLLRSLVIFFFFAKTAWLHLWPDSVIYV